MSARMDYPAKPVADLLVELGFTHVVWLPDSALGPWEAELDRPDRRRVK